MRSDQAQRAKIGQIEDASQTAEYHDALQQEADLTAGYGILRYTGLIAVIALLGHCPYCHRPRDT